jgi:hypothetical protein
MRPAKLLAVFVVYTNETEDPESMTLSAPPSGIVKSGGGKTVYSVRKPEIEISRAWSNSAASSVQPTGSFQRSVSLAAGTNRILRSRDTCSRTAQQLVRPRLYPLAGVFCNLCLRAGPSLRFSSNRHIGATSFQVEPADRRRYRLKPVPISQLSRFSRVEAEASPRRSRSRPLSPSLQ